MSVLLLAASLAVAGAGNGAAAESSTTKADIGDVLADVTADETPEPFPIAEVTVFSDRARVTRRGRLAAVPAGGRVQLPDLPGTVDLESVRLSVTGAKVIRLETTPVQRERYPLERVEAVLGKVEGLVDQLRSIQVQQQALEHEIAILSAVTPKAPVPEQERLGKAVPIHPEAWTVALGFLDARRKKARSELRALATRREEVKDALRRVEEMLGQLDLEHATRQQIEVTAFLLATGGGSIEVALTYSIPNAYWLPVYDLDFMADKGVVVMKSSALVAQATGEDWRHATLSLSTAVPGSGIALPELRTWMLGEKSEFMPVAIAAPRPSPTLALGAQSARATYDGATAQVRAALVAKRLQQLRAAASSVMPGGSKDEVPYKRTVVDFEDDAIEGSLSRPDGQYLDARKSRRAESPAAAAPAPVMLPSPSVAPAAAATEIGGFDFGSGGGGDLESVEEADERNAPAPVQRLGLALKEPTYYTPPSFSDPRLPAVAAGGFDYLFNGLTKADVPSNGKAVRVPIEVQRYPVELFYEVSPALSTTAYLRAAVKGATGRPVLRGAANIFAGGAFVGEAEVATLGPGGKLELPLGADDDVRVKRTVVPATTTAGVFSKSATTAYETTIQVANHKKRLISILVTDQLPKTHDAKIEIELTASQPTPSEGPDADGILRWRVDVPAGGTTSIRFTYTISRPADWRLYQ